MPSSPPPVRDNWCQEADGPTQQPKRLAGDEPRGSAIEKKEPKRPISVSNVSSSDDSQLNALLVDQELVMAQEEQAPEHEHKPLGKEAFAKQDWVDTNFKRPSAETRAKLEKMFRAKSQAINHQLSYRQVAALLTSAGVSRCDKQESAFTGDNVKLLMDPKETGFVGLDAFLRGVMSACRAPKMVSGEAQSALQQAFRQRGAKEMMTYSEIATLLQDAQVPKMERFEASKLRQMGAASRGAIRVGEFVAMVEKAGFAEEVNNGLFAELFAREEAEMERLKELQDATLKDLDDEGKREFHATHVERIVSLTRCTQCLSLAAHCICSFLATSVLRSSAPTSNFRLHYRSPQFRL